VIVKLEVEIHRADDKHITNRGDVVKAFLDAFTDDYVPDHNDPTAGFYIDGDHYVVSALAALGRDATDAE
jgi:hypothetical protein